MPFANWKMGAPLERIFAERRRLALTGREESKGERDTGLKRAEGSLTFLRACMSDRLDAMNWTSAHHAWSIPLEVIAIKQGPAPQRCEALVPRLKVGNNLNAPLISIHHGTLRLTYFLPVGEYTFIEPSCKATAEKLCVPATQSTGDDT